MLIMRKLIENELKKVQYVDLSDIEEGKDFVIKKRIPDTFEVNKEYIIELSDDLLVKGKNPILESNFNTVMNAGMVFKDENDGVHSLIDEKQLIAYDSTNEKVDKVTDVVDAWDSDEGILLQLNGLSLPGEYSSELTWTLVDSDM